MAAEVTAELQVFEKKNVSKYIIKIIPRAEDILKQRDKKFLMLGKLLFQKYLKKLLNYVKLIGHSLGKGETPKEMMFL